MTLDNGSTTTAQPAPPPPCQTITAIACNTPGFGTLCTALQAAGLASVLRNGTFTVFAPTDAAFEALPKNGTTSLPAILSNNTRLTDILLFHTVSGRKMMSNQLNCAALLYMGNGRESRTVCKQNGVIKHQKGAGNARDKMPIIVTADVQACNGVVHAVSQVMLP